MQGWILLHSAVSSENEKMVVLLLEAGADANATTGEDRMPCGGFSDLDTPLHFAAKRDSPRIITLLLHHGARIEQTNAGADTPLHSAVGRHEPSAQSLSVVRALVQAKANMNAKNNNGETPLDLAIRASAESEKRDNCVVDSLRVQGAKAGVNVPGPNGTPAKNPADKPHPANP